MCIRDRAGLQLVPVSMVVLLGSKFTVVTITLSQPSAVLILSLIHISEPTRPY